MEITANVEVEEIIKNTLHYFYRNMTFESFEVVCQEVFWSSNSTLRDCMGLVIAEIDDPSFIFVIEKAIRNERIPELKDDLNKVLVQLEEVE